MKLSSLKKYHYLRSIHFCKFFFIPILTQDITLVQMASSFILQIIRPVNIFLIIDVQNDFISGSLNISNCSAQQNGLEV